MDSLAAQRARSRQRARLVARMRAEPMAAAAEPLIAPEEVHGAALLEDDMLFDPPDEFLPPAPEVNEEATLAPANDAVVVAEEEEDAPPFDPPDEGDEIFAAAEDADGEELLLGARDVCAPVRWAPPTPTKNTDSPAPAIRIFASWDRPSALDCFAVLKADKRMARVELEMARGGLGAAIARCEDPLLPDLLIVDTDLKGEQLREGLRRLADIIARGVRVIVIGGVNDIRLLHEMNEFGVSEYIVAPAAAEDLVGSICALYHDGDTSRVIAVVGARGGVGASTVAHNLAWCIAERFDGRTALMDLDLPFGTAGFNFHLSPNHSVSALLDAPGEDEAFDRAVAAHTKRLSVLAAPVSLSAGQSLNAATFAEALSRVRRASQFVVLDLPHLWCDWVKHALVAADEVIVVAGPDLASLRNADNMMRMLRPARGAVSAPMVALSMVGVPKRPEIAHKDFSEALNTDPVATFPFEPEVFGVASLYGQMIGEVAPKSKMAQDFEALAAALTGREPVSARRIRRRTPAKSFQEAIAPVEAPLEASPVAPAPVVEEAPSMPGALSRMRAAREKPTEAPASVAPVEPIADEPPTPPQEKDDAYIEKARAAVVAELQMPPVEILALPEPKKSNGVLLRALAATTVLAGALAFDVQRRMAPEAVSATAAPVEALPPVRDLEAEYQTAVAFIVAGEDEAAAMRMRDVAEAGFAPAQYRLAKLYEAGHGVPTNLEAARRWTERAASAGHIRAMHDLGVYYARGEGADANDATAFRWFRQAAELGLADSQFNLGVLYQDGRGVTAEPAEALFWFLLASAQGDEEATARVAALEPELPSATVGQARARADAFRARGQAAN